MDLKPIQPRSRSRGWIELAVKVPLAVAAAALVSDTWLDRPEHATCADAYAYIASFPGNRVLSEDVTALILAGKPVLVSDPYLMTQLGSSVNWSRGTMQQLAADEYFDLIVLGGTVEEFKPESGRWPPALMDAIRQHYRLARRFDCPPCIGAAYVPKSSAGAG